MRIRKRSHPLLLSSLPLTDPPLTKTHEQEEPTTKLHPRSTVADDLGLKKETHVHDDQPSRSDLQLTLIRGKDGWFCLENGEGDEEMMKMEKEENSCNWCMNKNQTHKMEIHEKIMKMKQEVLEGLDKDEDGEMNKKIITRGCDNDNNNRKRNDQLDGAETISGFGVPPPSDHQVEKWCDGDMAFPLKKRRESFDRKVREKETMLLDMKEKRIIKSTKLKTKTCHKRVHHEIGDNEEDEYHQGVDDGFVLPGSSNSTSTSGVKKGTESIEGSRCSRVNGRGWRCYRHALVGYSLCEHHLDKRRLQGATRSRRSTSAVRSGSFGITNTKNMPDDEKTLRMQINSRQQNRKKIGGVKARSLSSLLGLNMCTT